MATKPAVYTGWVPDGSPIKIIQPPSAQALSGFVPGEPPVAQYINWILWNLDQWTQYLDQTLAASGAANAGALDNARLIGGGNWSFSVGTGTLSWSAAFSIVMPGIVDTDNQAAAGSIVVPDGSVVYVNAHVPFLTSGNTTSGSNQLTSVSYGAGIVVGQVVNGAGIPAGTTVTAFAGTTVTMSANATATATGVSLSFAGGAGLTVAVANEAVLQPGAGTVIIARRSGAVLVVGINSGEMILRDGELKLLRTTGYDQIYTGLAGEALTAGQAVYVSPGAGDGGRTLNSIYRADASITNGQVRSQCLGLVMTGAASGAAVQVIATGAVNSLAGLSVGVTYYTSPTALGGLVAGRPTVAGQWASPVGVAVSANQILVNAGVGSQMVSAAGAQGTYGVFNEAQLSAAIASATGVGGVIVVQAPFSVSSALTIPSNTALFGQLGQAPITALAGGSLTLADGATMRDVYMATALTSGNMLNVSGSYTKTQNCKFTIPPSSTGTCIMVTGSSNRITNCAFVGVVGSLATGITYQSGSRNIDDSSVFI